MNGAAIEGETSFPEWLAEQAARRRAAGLMRTLRPRGPEAGGILDLASNDYLGLARHPEVLAGGVDALHRWGAGATGSRLVSGSTALHVELEAALAEHLGWPAALVFSSGYAANLGVVTALSEPGMLVVSDERNHASLVDACRLSRAQIAVVPHANPEAVASVLAHRPARQRALVLTDGVFSADGDVAPLAELAEVCDEHGAVLVVDDAHGLGVVGPCGEGAAAAAGLSGLDHIVVTATLSKALGSQGGVVAGSGPLIEHVLNAARTFIFDTGLAPACVGSALAALRIVRREPERVAAVRRRAAELAHGLGSPVPAAAVVFVMVGESDAARAAAESCAAAGLSVACFRPPTVPSGASRLRLAARADLTDEEMDRAIRVVRQAVADQDAGSA